MMAFHKPRVYRSVAGCCICKAKSSSSRFTNSLKYEADFSECFLLDEPRKGEICNACVLLVKRFKLLPKDGFRGDWSHVVDGRTGPGMKSMTKRKKELKQNAEFAGQSNSNAQNIRNNTMQEKFGKIMKKTHMKKPTPEVNGAQDENSKPNGLSTRSENDIIRLGDDDSYHGLKLRLAQRMGIGTVNQSKKRKQMKPKKNANSTLPQHLCSIDLGEWSPLKLCCGMVYENKEFDALLIKVPEYSPESCPLHFDASAQASTSTVSPASTSSESENKDEVSPDIKLPRNKQYLKQCIIDATPAVPIDLSKPSTSNAVSSHVNQAPINNISKFRDNSGKVAKRSPKKIPSGIKNYVKTCSLKTLAAVAATSASHNKHNEQTEIKPIVGKKYRDSSSDSGYDDVSYDSNQLNQMITSESDCISRPVVLSNGILLHVNDPKNSMNAIKFAGVSPAEIQKTQECLKTMPRRHS